MTEMLDFIVEITALRVINKIKKGLIVNLEEK